MPVGAAERPRRQGARLYFVANLIAQASALARYVILARILGPEQLGLATMLILTAQFFESATDTGSDRFLIQDPRGDAPEVQRLVQLVAAARGALIGLALVATAHLLSRLYGFPSVEGSLMWLGIVPLIAGFAHLDMKRVQRVANFRPESLSMIFSETAGLLASAVAAWITRDHTAVIYGLAARSAVSAIVSHATATQSYRWGYNQIDGARLSAFAAPLFLNGLLVFIGGQGDRILVGRELGAAALGHYSAVLLLVYVPAAMLGRFITGIHLPGVAASRGNPERLAVERNRLGGRTLLLAITLASGFALVGPLVTPTLYGATFMQPLVVFALLGVLQAARFLRFWPTTLAIGSGRSSIALLNNIARMMALPLAIVALLIYRRLELAIASFVVGEFLAIIVSLYLLQQASQLNLGAELRRVVAFYGLGAALIATSALLDAGHWALVVLPILALLIIGVWTLRSERSVANEGLVFLKARLRPSAFKP